jgi:hypothetical protein
MAGSCFLISVSLQKPCCKSMRQPGLHRWTAGTSRRTETSKPSWKLTGRLDDEHEPADGSHLASAPGHRRKRGRRSPASPVPRRGRESLARCRESSSCYSRDDATAGNQAGESRLSQTRQSEECWGHHSRERRRPPRCGLCCSYPWEEKGRCRPGGSQGLAPMAVQACFGRWRACARVLCIDGQHRPSVIVGCPDRND